MNTRAEKAFQVIAIVLCLAFLIIVGCQQKVVCNKPYIIFGTTCCLDRNDNQICDSDENLAAVLTTEHGNLTPEEKPAVNTSLIEENITSINESAPKAKKNMSVYEALNGVVLVEMLYYNDNLHKDGDVLSSGTGFFVTPDGYILTNMHVVSPFDFDLTEFDVRIRVKTNSGNYYDANLIDWNYDYDIALLKLKDKKTKMKFLELGSSKSLKQGDTIYVLGNPLGLEQSLSKGVVSAKGRPGLNNEEIKAYLQTDAAVNPGNSGGPFLNEQGEVVGIATWGYGWQDLGLNFGLESDSAKKLYSVMMQVKAPIPTAPIEKCYLGSTGYIYKTSTYGFDEISPKFAFKKPSKLSIFYDAATDKLKFNKITLDFENKDDIPHEVCFNFKVISDGKVVLNKKITSVNTKPNMIISNQDINIDFVTPYLIQWYYYELNASDCTTDEQYYSFYRRDEYAKDYESGDVEVFENC